MSIDELNKKQLSNLAVQADAYNDNGLLTLKAQPGVNIARAAEDAIQAADEIKDELRLYFNGVSVRVSPFSNKKEVCRDWSQAHKNA